MEEIYKPTVVKARSPRKSGSYRPHFGFHPTQHSSNVLDPNNYAGTTSSHANHHHAHHGPPHHPHAHHHNPFAANTFNLAPMAVADEMMEVSSGLPHV